MLSSVVSGMMPGGGPPALATLGPLGCRPGPRRGRRFGRRFGRRSSRLPPCWAPSARPAPVVRPAGKRLSGPFASPSRRTGAQTLLGVSWWPAGRVAVFGETGSLPLDPPTSPFCSHPGYRPHSLKQGDLALVGAHGSAPSGGPGLRPSFIHPPP